MRRETFIQILSALMAEADDELLREAEGLVFWRKRELRAEKVQLYAPGQYIAYLAKDGKTRKVGMIDHLNKFSVSIKHPDAHEGFKPEVVMIERVLGLNNRPIETDYSYPVDLPPGFGQHAKPGGRSIHD